MRRICVLLALAWVAVGGLALAGEEATPTPAERAVDDIVRRKYTSAADIPDRDWIALLENVPEGERAVLWALLADLYDAFVARCRAEQQLAIGMNIDTPNEKDKRERDPVLAAVGNWGRTMRRVPKWYNPYPEMCDPADFSSFDEERRRLAPYVLGAERDIQREAARRIEEALDKTKDRREALDIIHAPYPPSLTGMELTPEERERLDRGEPVVGNPNMGMREGSMLWGNVEWCQKFWPARKYLEERRAAELKAARVDATPALAELSLKEGQLWRMDCSTSLHPLALLIVSHLMPPKENQEASPASSLFFNDYVLGGEVLAPEGSSREEVGGRTLSEGEKEARADRPIAPDSSSLLQSTKTHGAYERLVRGERDFILVSRAPSEDEVALAFEQGVDLALTPILHDGFVFITNRHNPVRNLSVNQARAIFAGTATTWKEVGGFGGDIHPLVRNRNSGSEELMRALVMEGMPVKPGFKSHLLSHMMQVFDNVAGDPLAIGYSLLYYERVMICNPHTRMPAVNGVFPTPGTVASGEYPLVYTGYAVTRKGGPAWADALSAWLASPEGQGVVEECGYVRVTPKETP